MSSSDTAIRTWTTTTLGALGKYVNGRAFKSTEWGASGRPIVRIQDLTGSNNRPNYFDGDVEERHVVRPGDLLISWSASLGAYLWNGPEAVLNQHIFKVESAINKRFHYHLARATIADLVRNSHGSGMVHVTKHVFEDTPVAIPDDPRLQQAVADFIDSVETAQGSALSHLESASRTLQQFGHSLLAAACSGRLTADWRASHPGNSDALVQSLRLRSNARHLGSARPVDVPSFDIPKDWSMVPIALLVDRVEAGKSFTCLPRHAREDEWGVIRVSAMSWGSFRPEEHKAVPHGRSINPTHEIHRGDLLVSRANTVELVGASVLVDETRPKLLLSDKSLRLIPHPKISKHWLNYALRSPMTRRQFTADATGTSDSMRNLSQKKILGAMVGLPPTDEQEEIVRRVSHLMRGAVAVAERIGAVDRQISSVSKAVLANAFQRGDASTTDSNSNGT
jgi:type I restriction enzyme, S subunit